MRPCCKNDPAAEHRLNVGTRFARGAFNDHGTRNGPGLWSDSGIEKDTEMNATYKLLMASTILGLVGTTAMAQSFDDVNSPVFSNENQLDDNLEDLDEDIEDDFEVDTPTFGNEGRELGFTGSISARGTATSGNTDTSTIGLGARFGFFDGVNGHEVKLSYSYFDAEDDADDLNRLLAGYDYTRDFSDTFYGFGTAVVAYDEDDSFETDAFIGAGVGYRVFNTPDVQWSIQAGPGYRYLETADGEEIDEAALSVSSNYYNRISPDLFITNDTDVIASDRDTYVTNDFGVTVSDERPMLWIATPSVSSRVSARAATSPS